MHYSLPNKLPDFSQASILVIGDVMLDRYWFGETSRISPEAPVPIVKIHTRDHRPGGAGNVAVNIKALGARVILLGLVGQDEAATILEKQLQSAEVQQDLCHLADISTIIKLRVVSRQQQLLRLDFEENLIPPHDDLLIAQYQKHLSQVNLVILSDYKKGTLRHPQALIQLAHAAGIPVLVDPKGTDFSIYNHADIITPNYKEFAAVVGPCHNEHDIVAKGRTLLEKFHIKTLLLTRGENGMTLIRRDQEAFHLPAYAREVYDVTGAGDTVIAALGTSVAAGADLFQATALANLAASLVVTKLGATAVSAPELEVALQGKTSITTGALNEAELLRAVSEARAQGKKIVFTNGCFDVFHAGHATCLQLAKQLGDYLVVAVNDDASIKQLKGPHRPINPLHDRMIVLTSLAAIDWVIPFSDATPERLLKLLQPEILVKGGDYGVDGVVGADIVRAYGGEVRVIHHPTTQISSSAIIERIQNTLQTATDRDEKDYV
jgi:D-beta-D-heptose 7-phosphate kinase/D-beta-D-heptose 1-phosphate adenosyltransferase